MSWDPLPEYVVLKTPPARHATLSVESNRHAHGAQDAGFSIPQKHFQPSVGNDQNPLAHHSSVTRIYTSQPSDARGLGVTSNSTLSPEPPNALTGSEDLLDGPLSAPDLMELDPFALSPEWKTRQSSLESTGASMATLSFLEDTIPYILPAIQQFIQRSGVATDISYMPLEKSCLPETWQYLQKQSPDIQFIHLITLGLVNNQDLVTLRNPESPLDTLYRAGIEYVLSLLTPELNRFLNSIKEPFSRAVEQGLVCAAVEFDAFRPLKAIIQRGLDPNGISCKFQGKHYLLLERACMLFNENSVRTLLELGADPTKHLSWSSLLEHCLAFEPTDELPVAQKDVIGIVSLLIDAGARPPPRQLSGVLGKCDSRMLEVLVAGLLLSSQEMFIQNGGLASILRREDSDRVTSLVQSILEQDYPPSIRDSQSWADVLTAGLSNAAYNHHMEAIQILLRAGARPNANCLANAVRVKNMQAVKLFLRLGVDANSPYVPDERDADEDPLQGIELNNREEGYECTALSEAILLCFPESFELFKSLGFMSKFAENEEGLRLALEAAAWIGDEALVDTLLAYPRSPSSDHFYSKNSFSSVISAAVSQEQDSIVRKLLHAGIHPDITTLWEAVKSRQTGAAQLLVDLVPRKNKNTFGYEMSSSEILFEAVQWSEINIVKSLLLTGVQLNEEFEVYVKPKTWRTSILGAAILRGKRTIANLLIDYGAAINVSSGELNFHETSCDSLTALAASVLTRDAELCHELLRHGADPCDDWALYFATEADNPEFVETLLDAFTKRYPSCRKHFGARALQNLLEDGDLNAFSRLAAFADANSLLCQEGTTYRLSALGCAIELWCDDYPEFLDILLKGWENPDVIVYEEESFTPNRKTALLFAIEHTNSFALVEQLVKAGASVTHPAKSRIARTPLQCAAEVGKEDIVRYLLEMGANPNDAPADHAGATALQLAAIQGHIRIASLLLQHDADVNAPPAMLDGRTAFEGAVEHGRIEMILFLVQKAANILDGKQYPRAIKFAERNGQLAAKELAKQLYNTATQNAMRAMLAAGDEVPLTSLANGVGNDWTSFDTADARGP